MQATGLYALQGSSGSQATLQRLTQETGVEVAKVQDDVKAKKQQVRAFRDVLCNYSMKKSKGLRWTPTSVHKRKTQQTALITAVISNNHRQAMSIHTDVDWADCQPLARSTPRPPVSSTLHSIPSDSSPPPNPPLSEEHDGGAKLQPAWDVSLNIVRIYIMRNLYEDDSCATWRYTALIYVVFLPDSQSHRLAAFKSALKAIVVKRVYDGKYCKQLRVVERAPGACWLLSHGQAHKSREVWLGLDRPPPCLLFVLVDAWGCHLLGSAKSLDLISRKFCLARHIRGSTNLGRTCLLTLS
eukprot:1157954-Pelagomonas_calceolata.AAC.2